jgi:hypothetical protein
MKSKSTELIGRQPVVIQTPLRSVTLAEFLQQPETEAAGEYFDGQVIEKSMAQGTKLDPRRTGYSHQCCH